MPAALNAFLRLELNEWTQSETRWINTDKWRACGELPVIIEDLAGRPCYSGLDLSSTTDITALAHVFPPLAEGEPYRVLCRFWVPDENMRERVKRDRVPYDVWIRHGYMTATPGNVTDYDWIIEELGEDLQQFQVKELAFDRWGSQKIVTDLQNRLGFTVDPKTHERNGAPLLVQFGQGFASMSGPMKELEKLILGVMLAHGGQPVLSWMAHNLVARLDPAGNVKPDKERSTERIDGMVALVMGLARAMLYAEKALSVYEQRGLTVI
jgi:phage terminase large subunit-like protein